MRQGIWTAAAWFACACGGTTIVDTSSGSGGESSSLAQGGGAQGSGGQGGADGFLCPIVAPADGSRCRPPPNSFHDRAHCTWGDDPRPDCRVMALCGDDGTWIVLSPNAQACSTSPLPAACTTPPPAAGATCDDVTLSCWYPDGERCWCSNCQGGTPYPICQRIDPPQWACASPPPGCPASIPQAGSACTSPGLSCGPSCELQVVCSAGVWVWRHGNCPVCAAPTTRVATPDGERAIATLREGDLVYSVDDNAIAAVPIRRVSSTPVVNHEVMRIILDSGAVLEISPGHNTADGGTFGSLQPGRSLDAHNVVVYAELVRYDHDRTFDILPDSTTGTYFASGALIGSTLSSTARR